MLIETENGVYIPFGKIDSVEMGSNDNVFIYSKGLAYKTTLLGENCLRLLVHKIDYPYEGPSSFSVGTNPNY